MLESLRYLFLIQVAFHSECAISQVNFRVSYQWVPQLRVLFGRNHKQNRFPIFQQIREAARRRGSMILWTEQFVEFDVCGPSFLVYMLVNVHLIAHECVNTAAYGHKYVERSRAALCVRLDPVRTDASVLWSVSQTFQQALNRASTASD